MAKMLTFSVRELLLILLYLEWPFLIEDDVTVGMYTFRREIEKQLASALYYALTADPEYCKVHLTPTQAKEILAAIHNASGGASYLRSDPCIRALETEIYRKMRSVV